MRLVTFFGVVLYIVYINVKFLEALYHTLMQLQLVVIFISYSGPKGSNFSGRSPRREEHKVYIKNVPLDMDKVSCCSFKDRIYNKNKNL